MRNFGNPTVYLERRRGDLLKAKQALSEGDFQTLQNMGHQWKGNAETFGFPDLGQLGARIEEAHDLDKLAELVHEFESWLNAVSPQT